VGLRVEIKELAGQLIASGLELQARHAVQAGHAAARSPLGFPWNGLGGPSR
jgi:hypothetical protein